jgi:2-polyprenyl-3-methyl-5-hydroxy-6-metoxy-1,4-benzoquinol methylase
MDFDAVYKEITAVSGSSYHARIKGRVAYTWERVSPLIKADSIVVEIGVGPMAAVVTQLKGAHVIGVDINDDQRDLCNRFKIDLRMRDVQAQGLPLEDESADVILLLEVIEHLCVYPRYILDEIYTKLKTNGYLVLSTVNFLRISSRIRVLLGRNPLINYFEPSEDGRNHIREFVPAEMAYYMRQSGFSIEKTHCFAELSGPSVISMLLRLAYLYPRFRNHFMVVGKKSAP